MKLYYKPDSDLMHNAVNLLLPLKISVTVLAAEESRLTLDSK